jgi:predicted kinase
VHINPDHFLETANGRIVTSERNCLAWVKCYAALERELIRQGAESKVVVLIGPQGAGKTTWARSYSDGNPKAIIFNAILVGRSGRQPIVEAVRARGGQVMAVWLQTPLAVCISRNESRPADEVVSEQAIRNVYAAIEPPSLDEGFCEIVVVT